ncbi:MULTISPECIES: hypothetical protein [Bacteria]|uniref:hypothetical protein n=1 Tax=Bacteria TaxID=2 RepID=UPI003C7D33F8
MGWRATTRIDRSSVELTRGSTWTIARVWSTVGTLEAETLTTGTSRILLSVDGTAEAQVEEATFTLVPRTMLVVPGEVNLSITNTTLWARCEWHLRTPMLRHGLLAAHHGKPLHLSRDHYQLLATMTNVVSTEAGFGESRGAGVLLDSFASVVAAAVLDAVDTTPQLSKSQAAIIERARQVIDERHVDPTFSVATLASELAVSPYYLSRLYAVLSTTPRRSIEARRVETARALLKLAPAHSHGAMLEVAHRSGFNTVRTLQAALRRQPPSAR